MNPRRSNRTLAGLLIIMMVIATLILSNVLFTMVTQKHFRSGVNVKDFKEPDISNTTVLKGNRGTIYDRGGEVIAQDEDTYTLVAILDKSRKGIGNVPAYVKNVDKTARLLAPKLDMKEDSIRDILQNVIDNKQYQTELGTKGKNLSKSVKESIEALELPGITFTKSVERSYPTGTFASHLIGYAQYNEQSGQIEGQMGLEKSLNTFLQGEDGIEVYQKDANGNILPGTKYTKKYAKNGNDVYLTLDRNVQLALQSSLKKTMKEVKADRGWGLVMEVETGKVLGWAGLPSFDLNKRDIKDYLDVPSQYLYEPGSVMKGITYAAALDSGNYPYNKKYDSGVFYFGTDEKGKIYRSATKVGGIQPIYDALNKNYGTISFDKGFIVSSNIAICELLTKYMDPSIYQDYVLNKFKFNQKVDIPFVENSKGNMNFTYASEKLNTGFGQGISVTALQMAQAYTAILNDGKMVRPYVVERIIDASSGKTIQQYDTKQVGQPISKKSADYVKKLMKQVIDDKMGTGHIRYKMDDVSIVAKTGTGQIANEHGQYGDIYTNSVMAAAPADDPKVMVYYAFESSEYLSYSGDPFKEVMKAALVAENITGEEGQNQETKKQNHVEWKEYTMPSLVNHTLRYAKQKLKEMDIDTVVIGNGNSIVAQFPKAGDAIMSNQRMFLLSDGAKIAMPNMKGWTKKDITAFWNLTHIEVQMEGSGSVHSQNVKMGKTISKDTIIKVKMK